jgi:pSer/pThr/pTyr-binding forkhead associated (FHA) protein
MDEYVEVKIDIFEHTGQRAKILRNLTISGLVDEIFKEFDDIPSDTPTKYGVYLKGNPKPLRSNATMTELDLQPQDELTFEYRQQNIREMLQPKDFASLTDPVTGRRYEVQWSPAIIGRPTAEADHNMMLAVNVELLPKGMTISRRHAQITFADDRYFVEPLAENNPVFVNGKEMPMGAMWEIKNGDQVTFGRYEVTLAFQAIPHVSSASRDTKSQAAPQARSQPIPQPVKPQSAPAVSSQPVQKAPEQPSVAAASPMAAAAAQASTPVGETSMDVGGTVMEMGAAKYSWLIVEKATIPGSVGQRIDMITYPFVIGRVLPIFGIEKGVSRQHAEINFDPQTGKFTFKDLNSTNGSRIEGAEIQPQVPYEVTTGLHFSLGQDVVVRFEM